MAGFFMLFVCASLILLTAAYNPIQKCRRIPSKFSFPLCLSPSDNSNEVVKKDIPIFSRENLPVFGVFIGLCAFSFQTLVLYPWHEKLHDDFDSLSIVARSDDVIDKKLESKIDQLIKLDLEILQKLKETK